MFPKIPFSEVLDGHKRDLNEVWKVGVEEQPYFYSEDNAGNEVGLKCTHAVT